MQIEMKLKNNKNFLFMLMFVKALPEARWAVPRRNKPLRTMCGCVVGIGGRVHVLARSGALGGVLMSLTVPLSVSLTSRYLRPQRTQTLLVVA